MAHDSETRSNVQPQFADCNNCFRTVGYFQRFEYRGDVIVHRRFGQIENAADRFIAFARRYQREQVDLPVGQA